MRFCRGALPRFTPAVCCIATNRTACDSLRSCSAGSRSPFARSRGVGAVICLCGFTLGLAVFCRRSRRVTGDGGNGADGVAFVRLCAAALTLQCFLRGVRWGCAPQTAPKSRLWKRHCRLSGLSSRCGGAGLVQIRRRHPGTRKDLPGSDLWPGRSGCIEMIPTRTIVQTRAAPKRRRVGLTRAERRGSRHSLSGLFG